MTSPKIDEEALEARARAILSDIREAESALQSMRNWPSYYGVMHTDASRAVRAVERALSRTRDLLSMFDQHDKDSGNE